MAPKHLRLLTCAENFQDWYEGIVIELRLQGVFRVVSAEFTRPVIPVSTEENPVHPSDIRAAVALVKQWDDDNSKAIGIIHAALSAPIRHEFMLLTDGNQLLHALKERYEIVNSVFSLEGLQIAISTTYPRCKDIYDYIEKMSARLIVSTRVLAPGEFLSRSVRVQFLFCNLGETWQTFLAAYLNFRFDKESSIPQLASHLYLKHYLNRTKPPFISFPSTRVLIHSRAQKWHLTHHPSSRACQERSLPDAEIPSEKRKKRKKTSGHSLAVYGLAHLKLHDTKRFQD